MMFSIGIVSTRVGVHQQTLREYERQGLIVPARTPKGTRRYSEQDIARLIRIQQLTSEGMSLVAAGYVLMLEARVMQLEDRLRRTGAGSPEPQPDDVVLVVRTRRSRI